MSRNRNNLSRQRNKPAPSQTSKVVNHEITETFVGPMPPPAILSQYDAVSPGLAEKIIDSATKESDHRRTLEKKALEANTKSLKMRDSEIILGQVLGFLVAIIGMGMGAYLALNGSDMAGSIIGVSGVTGLAAVFVIGRKKDKDK